MKKAMSVNIIGQVDYTRFLQHVLRVKKVVYAHAPVARPVISLPQKFGARYTTTPLEVWSE
jgi:hypothetical protein